MLAYDCYLKGMVRMYYNIGLGRVKNLQIADYEKEYPYMVRKVIHKPLKSALGLFAKREIIVESYPKLEPGRPYIFVSTHSFDEDVVACLSTIDRNAYMLAGTTDQLEHNPQMYAAWANGMIYVDRDDEKSRRDAVIKMTRVIEHGTSVLLWPEGGYNNTENLLCMELFASPYILNQTTNALVVPISVFNEYGSDKVYFRASEAMDFTGMEKREALLTLRDELATMVYLTMEEHTTPLVRRELEGDLHMQYMEQRKNVYLDVKWTRDVWDEELTRYIPSCAPLPENVREFADVVHVDKDNAYVLAPVLAKRMEDHRYNFKQYMKENWNR